MNIVDEDLIENLTDDEMPPLQSISPPNAHIGTIGQIHHGLPFHQDIVINPLFLINQKHLRPTFEDEPS